MILFKRIHNVLISMELKSMQLKSDRQDKK